MGLVQAAAVFAAQAGKEFPYGRYAQQGDGQNQFDADVQAVVVQTPGDGAESFGGIFTEEDVKKDDFKTFYDWAMANGYADNLSIDRINPDGNYEPSNCRWITQREQAGNKRCTPSVELDGEIHNLKEWSEITGINYSTIYSRYISGKTPAEILRKGACL